MDGQITNPMSHLVRPDRPISPQAMAIHHITEEMVADKPWIEEIVPLYMGSPWYVAHNASFDRRVLPEMQGEWLHHVDWRAACGRELSTATWGCINRASSTLPHHRGCTITPGAVRLLYPAALLLDIVKTSGWSSDDMADYQSLACYPPSPSANIMTRRSLKSRKTTPAIALVIQ